MALGYTASAQCPHREAILAQTVGRGFREIGLVVVAGICGCLLALRTAVVDLIDSCFPLSEP